MIARVVNCLFTSLLPRVLTPAYRQAGGEDVWLYGYLHYFPPFLSLKRNPCICLTF